MEERLKIVEAESNVITLHPASIDRFASDIEVIHRVLSQPGESLETARCRAAFRNVFERFAVVPTPKRAEYRVRPVAWLSDFTGMELFPKVRSVKEILAEQGVTMLFAATETTSML